MSEVTIEQLAKGLADAGAEASVNAVIAPVAKRTGEKIAQTQRDTVRRRSGKTADSITVRTPDGKEPGPKDVDLDIGPTWFVGTLLERGTVNMPPFPFVEHSADPHMAAHVDQCGTAVADHIARCIG